MNLKTIKAVVSTSSYIETLLGLITLVAIIVFVTLFK